MERYAAGQLQIEKVKEMDRKVRIGIVGLGGIAQTHLRQCRDMAGRVEVVAGAEIRSDLRKQVCARYSIPSAYKDGITMMEREILDGVILCVPPAIREPLIQCALERGIGVLCEKPLAVTLEEGERILKCCREYPKIPVLVNFKMRQGENFQRVKEFLSCPEVGRPVAILSRYALVTDPAIWTPPRWFWDRDISGGLLIENAGHMIDYILWTAGRVKRLFGYTEQKMLSTRPEEYMKKSGTEDHAVLILQHENGCTTTFVNTICYPGNRDGSIEIATTGGYFLEVRECVHLRIRKGEEILVDTKDEAYGIGDGYTLKHFTALLRQEVQESFVSVQDGYNALEVAVKARESAERGTWMEIRRGEG